METVQMIECVLSLYATGFPHQFLTVALMRGHGRLTSITSS